jgi:hypothetical protein
MLLSVPVWVLREILELARYAGASRITLALSSGYETGDGTYRFTAELEFGVSESEAATLPQLLRAMRAEHTVDNVKLTIVPESLQIYSTGAARISLIIRLERCAK